MQWSAHGYPSARKSKHGSIPKFKAFNERHIELENTTPAAVLTQETSSSLHTQEAMQGFVTTRARTVLQRITSTRMQRAENWRQDSWHQLLPDSRQFFAPVFAKPYRVNSVPGNYLCAYNYFSSHARPPVARFGLPRANWAWRWRCSCNTAAVWRPTRRQPWARRNGWRGRSCAAREQRQRCDLDKKLPRGYQIPANWGGEGNSFDNAGRHQVAWNRRGKKPKKE